MPLHDPLGHAVGVGVSLATLAWSLWSVRPLVLRRRARGAVFPFGPR